MDNIDISKGEYRDAKEIAKVLIRSWQKAYKGYLPYSYLNRMSLKEKTKEWQKKLSNIEPKSSILIAKFNNTIIGFCNFGLSRDEDANEYTGELYNLYIAPEYMDKGIGTLLMNQGLKQLKEFGFKKVTLWTSIKNEQSRKFYEKNGWINEGLIKKGLLGGFEEKGIRYIFSLDD